MAGAKKKGNPNGNPQYLKPWKPGQSGNPSGRPKGCGLLAAMSDYLRTVDTDGMTKAEKVAMATVELALRGHPQALKEVWGRMEGAIPQVIDATEKRGKPTIHVIWGRDDEPKRLNGSNGTGTVPPGVSPANGTR